MTKITAINPSELNPALYLPAGNRLGECPTYDNTQQRLYWVDILASQYHWSDHSERPEQQSVSLPFEPGFVALLESGGVLTGGDQQLMLEDNGTTRTVNVPVSDPREVINDGKVTPDGQCLVFGTRDRNEEVPVGRMIVITANRTTVFPDRFTVFNGPAFSPCGSIIYFADSAAGKIWKATFSTVTGEISAQSLFANVSPEHGYPDGMCVDDEGCLWSAHWDGSCVSRYRPDGSLDTVVKMPVIRPTSVTFGGPARSTLYVTSAMPDEQTSRTDTADISDGDLLSLELPVTGPASVRLAFNPLKGFKK